MPALHNRSITLFCLIAFTVTRQPLSAQVTFQKVFGGSSLDNAAMVLEIPGEGYIICGSTASYGMGDFDAIVIKTNTYGDTLWTRTYGRNRSDGANQIIPLPGGDYVLSGWYTIANGTNTDVYLCKMNSNGQVKWSKAYGGAYDDGAAGIITTSDGGYVLVGTTASYGQATWLAGDIYILRTDSASNLLWAQTFGTSDGDSGEEIIQTNDGGYVALCSMWDGTSGDVDIGLVKLDALGNLKWIKTYGGNGGDGATSLLPTKDNGCIVCGYYNSGDVFLLKADSVGNLQWAKTYGGNNIDVGIDFNHTMDNGYIVTGYTYSFGAGNADVYLLKVDSAGGLEWSKTFGGTNNDAGYSVQQTQDSGYVIAGYTKSFGAGDDDIYLIKTDKYGTSGCNETDKDAIITNVMDVTSSVIVGSKGTLGSGGTGANVITSTTSPAITNSTLCLDVGVGDMPGRKNGLSLEIYPNPTSGRFTAAFNLKGDSQVTLTIFDICGRAVQNETYNIQVGAGRIEADLSGFAEGIYMVKVSTPGGYAVKRVVYRR